MDFNHWVWMARIRSCTTDGFTTFSILETAKKLIPGGLRIFYLELLPCLEAIEFSKFAKSRCFTAFEFSKAVCSRCFCLYEFSGRQKLPCFRTWAGRLCRVPPCDALQGKDFWLKKPCFRPESMVASASQKLALSLLMMKSRCRLVADDGGPARVFL